MGRWARHGGDVAPRVGGWVTGHSCDEVVGERMDDWEVTDTWGPVSGRMSEWGASSLVGSYRREDW